MSVAYPGPCSLRKSMSRLNVTLPSAPAVPVDPRRRTSARSAWDDLQEYTACTATNQCPGQSCQPACGTSDTCKTKCETNCECNCLKMPGSDANPDNAKLLNDCIAEKQCFSTMTTCNFKCKPSDQECMASCTMDFMKCGCECNRLGSGSGGGGGSGGGNDDKKGGSAPGARLGATTAVALTATWLARALAAAAW
ncbi:hypothetical protein FOCC_FOCC011936 [Frankliniella occidentalis]|nr:hypothetical protein FOCC_FOCC011936 [Frankliniella occidentalis]